MELEDLMTFSGWVVATLFCLSFLVLIGFVICFLVIDTIKKIRGRKMLKLAKAHGPVVVANTEKRVTAVCSYEAFKKADRESYESVIGEKDAKKRAELFMKRREILVVPTFTFADDDVLVIAHTGSRFWAEKMRSELVKRVTGYDRSQVPYQDFDIATSFLAVSEERLLIPFMRPLLAGFDPEKQMELFGNKSVDDAFRALLPAE